MQTVAAEQALNFAPDGGIGFAGQSAAVDGDGTFGGNDVSLDAAGNGADVDGGVAEKRMSAAADLRGVIRLQKMDDAGHLMDGVAAEFGPGAVGGEALGFELEPEIAFVGGDDLQTGGFADDGEIGLEAGIGQCARTALGSFLVHEAGKNDFGFGGALPGAGEFANRGEHGGDGAFGVARAASVEAAVFDAGNQLVRCGDIHRVQMRREQDALADFAGGSEPGEDDWSGREGHFAGGRRARREWRGRRGNR